MEAVIGTAGWSIATSHSGEFPSEGTSLERYSQLFNGVEINSSFHRSHRKSTWEKWAASVPDGFRFAAKIPKTITHQTKLVGTGELVEQFRNEVAPLENKLAVLLVQLPPKLAFEAKVAERFFSRLRSGFSANIVCEPRHPDWFEPEAERLLEHLRVSRAAADPALSAAAAAPGGWQGFTYWRLHGSPVMYRSSYGEERIEHYASEIGEALESGRSAWCIFDNTASSAATGNALSLIARLRRRQGDF